MDSEHIEHEAADWLAKRDSGDWSDVDERAFAEWQAQSTAHRVAVIRVKTIWQKADRLQALGAGVPRGQIPGRGSWQGSPFFEAGKPSAQFLRNDDSRLLELEEVEETTAPAALQLKPRKRTLLSRLATLPGVAAALILGVGAASAWYFTTTDPNVYRSAIGNTKVVSLTDGSTVTLNTNSTIRVALTVDERRIDLERGEAFFEVAKDPKRPFVVSTANKRIVAVGTKFSVFRGDLDTRVVVTEGQVKVEEVQDGDGPVTQLPAGSIAQAGSAGVLVKHSSVAEAETYISWRSGYIALRDTQLTEAVAEFNRYNQKQLVIADPAIAQIRIGGNLRATNVDAFVRVLDEGFAVHAEDQGNRIVLTGKVSPR